MQLDFPCVQVYPATMQYLTKGGANVLSLMWFGVLWLLGIDSMFAMVEGVATVITDTPRFKHLRKVRFTHCFSVACSTLAHFACAVYIAAVTRPHNAEYSVLAGIMCEMSQLATARQCFLHSLQEIVALVTCMCGFIASIAFITDIGFYLLDQFDHYILNYGALFNTDVFSCTVQLQLQLHLARKVACKHTATSVPLVYLADTCFPSATVAHEQACRDAEQA